MGWVGEVDCRYLTHPALRAPLQWRGSAVAELTLNIYLWQKGIRKALSGLPLAQFWERGIEGVRAELCIHRNPLHRLSHPRPPLLAKHCQNGDRANGLFVSSLIHG